MVEVNVNNVLWYSAVIVSIWLILTLVYTKKSSDNVFQNMRYQIQHNTAFTFQLILVIAAFVVPMYTDNAYVIYTLAALTGFVALQVVIGLALSIIYWIGKLFGIN